MIRKLTFLLLALSLFVTLTVTPLVYIPSASAADVWVDVSTPDELKDLSLSSTNLTLNYRLTQDIDLSGADLTPIGQYNIRPFVGKFDGQGHVIKNFTVNKPGANYVGFFSYTDGATISNVHFMNATLRGTMYVGGLAGHLKESTVSNVSFSGTVSGNDSVGGLTGYSDFSKITDSYVTGTVASGASPQTSFGGIAGYATGNNFFGGIFNSYANAVVTGGSNAGGLVGRVGTPPKVQNAYWDTESSGVNVSAGGGTGKTKAELMRKATFSGWDFAGTWGIIEEITPPLAYSQYAKVALNSLTVTNAPDGAVVSLDRDFSSDYGKYTAQVVNKMDEITVTGSPMTGSSAVSVNGGGNSESIPLNPGSNSITIKVTDTDGASAEYELTVIRDAGTAGYPHRITSAEQLASIGNLTEGYKLSDFYRLDADLNLAAAGISNWSPIGSSVTPFNGVFDGNHHTIANVTISQPSADEVGFFGRTNSAQLHDFALVNVQVTGRDHVGGLIGYAEDTPVSSVSVQGAVYGQDHAGGLIGTLIAATPSSGLVDYSFSAAYVSAVAGSSGGLIGTTTVADVVTHSFWDMATSGQAITYGGGLGKTTNDLMTKSTFTAGGWQFGSGHSWEIIDGTGYPTPLATFAHLTLSGLTLSTPGSSNSMRGFQSGTGLYSPSLSTPVGAATILATPSTPDATVTFNGTSSNNVALTLGSNPVLIRVTSPDGISQGLYRMNINVPTPEIQSLQVPSNGTYGLGEPMDFTVTYTQPVTISGTPVLPLHLAGTDVNAVYTGQPAGQPTKLKFRYIVQTGDTDPNGIEVGTALSLAPSATITSIGQDVPLTIAGVPSLSGIVIDGIVPAILSVPATTTPTNGPITVNVTADGTGSALTSLKWAAGTHPASYFTSSGTVVTAGAFQVTDNGTYTIYAKDAAGNTAVSTLEITNIITQNPSMLLDFNPKELVHTGVDVTVTAEAADAGTGNAIADLQWAEGARSAADFAAPGFGTAIPLTGSFHVTHNGTYTVYAIDMAGNQKVETITIANIVTQLPVIALDYTPKSIGVSSVTLTVTASVYEEGTGNTLNSLRWARGDLAISSFADPAFGTDVPASGLIPVTQNGKYTVYASDLAGNEQAVVIEITNVSEASNSDSAAAPAAPVTPPGQFYVEPGKAYTFTFEGLTVQIPAGAVKVPTTITVKRAGTDAQQLITQGQALLSEAYRLTKDVTGKFAVPISLTFTADLSKEKRPAVFYYDEATKQWTKLPSKAEGSLITGETDHFTLFAVLPAAESKPLVLSDITGHWAEQIIRSSAAQGWISGYPDGTFLPNRAVSRAEFAVLLNSVLHLPAGQSLPFADASSIPAWASPAVASAVQAGILSGYEDRTFRPDVSITRTEATVMIAKAAGLAETQAAATGFADDARIAGWAKGWIASALSAKLVQGQAGNAFQPQASTTRAEAVVLLQRLAARQP